MISKFGLCLAAVAVMAVAIEASPARLQEMRSRFQNAVHPSSAYATASAAASGFGSTASSTAETTGEPRPFASRYAHPAQYQPSVATATAATNQQPRYEPAPAPIPSYQRYAPSPAATSAANSAGSTASASGPSGSATAAAHSGDYRYAPRPQPAAFNGRRSQQQQQQPDEFYAPEVYDDDEPQYEPAAFQPRFKPVPAYPPVPRVSANRAAFNNRVRFGNGGGVSTSAAAGAGSASAASAASGFRGPRANAAVAQAGNGAASQVSSSGASAKASASAVANPAGYDAHEVENEHTSEHYSEPNSVNQYEAKTGVYANDGSGLLTSSYVRNTESEENHEDGKEDSDHYYNAGSYGKTYDENHSESYDNDDEDVVKTPTLFRSKKSSTKYQKDGSKQRRESGSRVLAKDSHSASYNKDNKRFKENVDKHFHKEGEGVLESGHSSEASDFDEESEEQRDSRNLGDFVGVDGVRHAKRPMFNPAAAAASASASSAGVTSSTSG